MPDAYETQIRATFPQLDVWGARVSTPFMLAPGAPLSEDDQVFQWLSTADIAWQALCAAQDHLKGFRAWLVANDSEDRTARPGLFPIATFSLLRGALVGGAIAAWVLASDDVDVRTGRSLTVAADWYRNHLNWGEVMRPYAADPARHQSQLAHVAQRAGQVATLRATRHPKGRLKTTDAIIKANAELWPGDESRAVQTEGLWRAGSGDAHALGWSILTRAYDVTPLGDGMGQFVGAPPLLDVANSYFCAYDFVTFGFYRLDQLNTPHAPVDR